MDNNWFYICSPLLWPLGIFVFCYEYIEMSLIKLYFLLYLIPSLSTANAPLAVGGAISMAISFVCWMMSADWMVENEEDIKVYESLKVNSRRAFKFSILFFILSILTFCCPSKKDIIAIYGIHYASTNKDISQLPANAAKFLNQQLQKQLTGDNE
jgi:hypothetical protein